MRDVLTDERSAHLLVTEEAEPEAAGKNLRLSRGEWLAAHMVAFLVGCWNLALIDYAHDREQWWCWLPLAIWSAVLVLHGGWILLARRWHRRSSGEGAAPTVVSPTPAAPVAATEWLTERPVERPSQQPFSILLARGGAAGQVRGSGMVDGAVD